MKLIAIRIGSMVILLAALVASSALAQSTVKATLSGIVVDSAGAIVPGAAVTVKNTGTGVTTETITNPAGAFAVPALDVGTYSVTVSLTGFKTAVVTNVRLIAGEPASVQVKLEVGNLEERVEVKGGTDLIQTQSTAVASTISADQIQNLPLTSRNALSFVAMLPGVDTSNGVVRDSTLFGLPEQAINITIDGINTNNNFQRSSDGFYSMVFPQLDAVEQVTVTGAVNGAEAAGGGSVQIRFVTRSGTNQYRGTGYYYFRHPDLNTNYYFLEAAGLPKNRLILNQFGGSLGGPIKIPRVYDGTNKAFFFFNYEEFYQPTSADRTRTLLHPLTQSGIFRYNVVVGGVQQVREVNLLQLAAASGHLATPDATAVALLAQIRSLAEQSVRDGTGSIADANNVNQQQFLYLAPGKYYNHLPTTKLDFNLTSNHRLSGSYWWQEVNRFPDIQNNGETTFPGLPNVANYTSVRSIGSVALRSAMSSTFVNELVGGWQWSPGTFNSGVVAEQFDNQAGFSLGFPLGATSATRSTNPNSRHQDNWNINNTVSWLKGSHNLSFGGGYTRVGQWNDSTVVVPSIAFGVQSGLDPADAMFNTTNFPNASTANLNDARALYAFLTGRVVAVNALSRLDEDTLRYQYLGTENIRISLDEYSAFVQDSWRLRPTLTLNYGLAYQVQMPLKAANGVYSTTDYAGFCGPYGIGPDGQCKIFQVGGEQTGVFPSFVQYTAGTRGYKTDWNNVAPNIGAAWRPSVQTGWLRTILGDPEQATIRGGFSIAYNRPGFDEFTAIYNNNPGRTYNSNRTNDGSSTHLLVNPGESWPVLFRDTARLGPPSGIPDGPTYPIPATAGTSLAIFDPDIEVPYTRSFSVGLQRAVSKDMALEVRYVGTRGMKGWVTENWNETNVIENGFLDEFRLAQANLRAHVDAGCGTAGNAACSFAYRGPGTGTSPLPTYLAYLSALPSSRAQDPSAYSAALFTNSTFLGRLSLHNPQVMAAANTDLLTAARRSNALTAGLPSNFFNMNPAVGSNSVNLRTSTDQTRYDALTIELRRRLANGFLFTTNYTLARRHTQALDTLRQPERLWVRQTGNTSEIPHAWKATMNWELPVGRGRRFGSDMGPWLNGVLGDWSFNMTGRVQSGRLLTVTNSRLVGMTEKELQDMYKIRFGSDGLVYMLPDDVILNTRRAYDTSPTSGTGYGLLGPPEGRYLAPASRPDCVQVYPGDCAPRNLYLTGPVFTRFDMSFKKGVRFNRRLNFVFELDVLNVFDAINFIPVFNPGPGGGTFQVTQAFQDISGTYDPGGRLAQLVWRINW